LFVLTIAECETAGIYGNWLINQDGFFHGDDALDYGGRLAKAHGIAKAERYQGRAEGEAPNIPGTPTAGDRFKFSQRQDFVIHAVVLDDRFVSLLCGGDGLAPPPPQKTIPIAGHLIHDVNASNDFKQDLGDEVGGVSAPAYRY
jgi:hypothetical protein